MNRIALLITLLTQSCFVNAESTCYGTTSNGWLEKGVKLPGEGPNFESYSSIAGAIGRTYVHSKVKEIIVESYALLKNSHPQKVFKYAETGFNEGGRFKPHKTHQNGLSVDFMVPVIDKTGKSVHLPTHPLNKWGYSIEFDKKGSYEGYAIDYEALSAHIVALDKVAKKKGLGLWRVIFDPTLQPHLLKTKHKQYIAENIQLSSKRSWVRHDEHYHVDFAIPCKASSQGRNR